MFSKSCEYAIKAMIFVAQKSKSDLRIGIKEIARGTDSPEHFIEISKDNITYYKLGSENLPMIFEQVPPGESRDIYVRSIKNSKFSSKNSTAQIIVDWLTTV